MLTFVFVSTFILWALFGIIFPLYKRHQNATGWKRVALAVLVYSFVLLDVAYNATVGSLIFWQLPFGTKLWFIQTFSKRVAWNYTYKSGHRYRLAKYFRNLILRTDPEHF